MSACQCHLAARQRPSHLVDSACWR